VLFLLTYIVTIINYNQCQLPIVVIKLNKSVVIYVKLETEANKITYESCHAINYEDAKRNFNKLQIPCNTLPHLLRCPRYQ